MTASASSLKFGTSGLRGLVVDLDGAPATDWTRAFVDVMAVDQDLGSGRAQVFVGRDLRASSPSIATRAMQAIQQAGFTPVDCGALPTPALALAAMSAGAPAVMVTGSHIPDDRNGLKFYRPTGEIDKQDEAKIVAAHARVVSGVSANADAAAIASPVSNPVEAYVARYTGFFAPDALHGLKVGVYQHSTVARDVIVTVLEALGAHVVPLGRSDRFIPVDTEAVRDEDQRLAVTWALEHGLDALVSADGDADRPLVADHKGSFLRGDLLGVITARHLGLDVVVTPVTSNGRMEQSGGFRRVVRTKVGSPFVIAGMQEALASGGRVLGFEANGGALLGSAVTAQGRTLAALMTRDALLPILCALAETRKAGKPLQAIVAAFGFNAAASTRIENCPFEKSSSFLTALRQDAGQFFGPRGPVVGLDQTDGLRFTLANGDVMHLRASGNAPELRVYTEAPTEAGADNLLAWAVIAATAATA